MKGEKVLRAAEYAQDMHAGQKRKDGKTDYIVHPVSVAYLLKEKGYSDDYIIAGLFHDLLEDTKATEEKILSLSNKAVLDAVKLLTKEKRVRKAEYIARILKNPIAKAVKNEDRICNLFDMNKLPQEENKSFINKYLEETRDYFYGKFSKDLDDLFVKYYGNLYTGAEASYTKDGSISDDVTPVYKKIGDFSYIYNRATKEWESKPFFWVELEDQAESISKEEAKKIIKNYN